MLSTGLMAQTPVVLKAARVGHVLVLKDVFLNGKALSVVGSDSGDSAEPDPSRRRGGLGFVQRTLSIKSPPRVSGVCRWPYWIK